MRSGPDGGVFHELVEDHAAVQSAGGHSHPCSAISGGSPAHNWSTSVALGQRAEDGVQLLLQQREADRLTGLDRLGVLYQVAGLAVAVLTERGAISPAAATTGSPST
jgi:hypothetical protein